MTRWDIHPEGVQGVLARTEAVAKEFEGQMKTLNSSLQGAAEQSSSEIVAKALEGLVQSQTAQIQFVFTRTGACMNACARATNEYLQGDLQMAANAQASASSTAEPAVRTFGPRR